MSQRLKEWALTESPPVDEWLCDPEYEKWAKDYDAVTAEIRETMNINDVYTGSSNFLKASDLKGKGVKLVIEEVKVQEFDEKGESGPYKANKLILSFKDTEKEMVVNKTNGRALGAMYGEETDAWIGKPIKLYTAMVDFQGSQVPAIRIQVDMPETDFDDDIPF